MIDTEALKTQVNLPDLIGQDVPLRWVSGDEYHGPCPWCGGTDRFLVRPHVWTCRQCLGTDRGQWQDAIAYVQRRQDLDFAAACDWLARWGGLQNVPRAEGPLERRVPLIRDPEAPDQTWQERGRGLVVRCEQSLWSNAGVRARSWLHKRGLRDDTLKAWRIGFNDAGGAEQGCRVYGLWVWHGIVIPWSDGHSLWAINVRRPVSGQDKYRMVSGSRKGGALFGMDKPSGKTDCVIVEGEFDAMLLWQEAGDLADVLTLGSASGRLADRWLPALIGFERFWIATDDDEAGQKIAAYWQDLVGSRARRILPEGKDVTEAWQSGRDLRSWAASFLLATGSGTHLPTPTNAELEHPIFISN